MFFIHLQFSIIICDMILPARTLQAKWKTSSFAQRRHLLHVISRCITENMETVTRVACRDSGKAKVDAYMGEGVFLVCF